MTYMFLTYLDEKAWADLGEAEQQRLMHACDPHVKQLRESGKFLAGAPLHPTSTATTIRNHEGQRLVTDGPYAETREQLGGYTLIDAKDLDEAIAIAWGFAGNSGLATIEIRPVAVIPDLPSH
ncbi:MAG TPA: YciI family protein [Bryobacteraceae bacterium]|nr:YciI family protein [Bryobacteraceae bacterium]